MHSESKRPYRKKSRALQEEQTRLRITEAVVDLHRTVGPARTTISEVAERAGVGRMTVYKHFPSDLELFQACSAHWSEQNPAPDFGPCLDETDADKRAVCVLQRLYLYYRSSHDMMGKVLRDAPLLPSLQEVVEQGWIPLQRELETALLPAGLSGNRRKRRRAAARVALDLRTWETLTATGLSDHQAAELAAGWLD